MISICFVHAWVNGVKGNPTSMRTILGFYTIREYLCKSVSEQLVMAVQVNDSAPSKYGGRWLIPAISIAALIFACILTYNISLYEAIGPNWKVAIASFIILLPLAFFLQAFLHAKAVRIELGERIQRQLRDALIAYDKDTDRKAERLVSSQNNAEEWAEYKKAKEREKEKLEKKTDMFSAMPNTRTTGGAVQASTVEYEARKLNDDLQAIDLEISDSETNIEYYRNEAKEISRDLDGRKLPELKDTVLSDIEQVSYLLSKRARILQSFAPEVFGIYKRVTADFINELIRLQDAPAGVKTPSPNPPSQLLKRRLTDLLEFELGLSLDKIRDKKMQEDSLEFNSYLLPLTFFLFTFFAGWLLVLPLVNSIFIAESQTITIPLFDSGKGIPLIVIQWGFLGGLVYTSINLLTRFLRKDLVPRVYFMASLRLLLSAVVAVLIYFVFMFGYQGDKLIETATLPPQVLLLVFSAGIAPIQILSHIAEVVLSKLDWTKKKVKTGDKPLTDIPGIGYIKMDRLGEEGIDCISHLALCEPIDVSIRTRYEIQDLIYWKDQAILYLLTNDIIIKNDAGKRTSLYDILHEKYGIQRWSVFNEFIEHLIRQEHETLGTEPKWQGKTFLEHIGLDPSTDREYFYDLLHNLRRDGANYLSKSPVLEASSSATAQYN